ncbi:MAG: hypothetical protein R3F62_21640 [Planctomycetota bacterium]
MPRTRTLTAAVVLLAVGCRAPAPTSPLPVAPAPVAEPSPAAQTAFERALQERYRPAGASRLEVSFAGAPLVLPAGWALEVQRSSGHGGGVTFQRWEARGDELWVEDVEWVGPALLDDDPPAQMRRARLGMKKAEPLLACLRQLPTVELRETGRFVATGPGTGKGSGWLSSDDFFLLLRVLDSDGAVLFERSFAGYPSSTKQLAYLPQVVAIDEAQRVLAGLEAWSEVPPHAFRSGHVTASFARSRRAWPSERCTWVLDRALNALASFGHPGVLSSLEALRAEVALAPRAARKVDALLDAPELWLTGLPKHLPDE